MTSFARIARRWVVPVLWLGLATAAHADAVATLKRFVTDVKSGKAEFTQVVTTPNGVKKAPSTGVFEFERPNRFRFSYSKPYEQLIVSDGKTVSLFDPDLNQVTVRGFDEALGATPAALLAGGSLDRDFDLKALPDEAGLSWVQALPHAKDGPFQSLKVGFKGAELAAVDILDAFGQRSRLDFTGLKPNVALGGDRFRFVVPSGADVIRQ